MSNAKRLLDKYHDTHAVFNDDVYAPSILPLYSMADVCTSSQGTGAVTLACIMSAVGVTKSTLADQRFVVFGAGSAGLGITRQLRDGIVSIDGLDKDEANKRFYLVDRYGLIKESLGREKIRDGLQEFVRPDSEWEGVSTNAHGEVELLEVVRKVRPTVLIGCSTRAGAFSEEVVREMAKGTDRPIILPLSNPSKLHEVTPQDATDWTAGKALLATGSPFPPCRQPNGKDYMCVPLFSLCLCANADRPCPPASRNATVSPGSCTRRDRGQLLTGCLDARPPPAYARTYTRPDARTLRGDPACACNPSHTHRRAHLPRARAGRDALQGAHADGHDDHCRGAAAGVARACAAGP